MKPQTIELGWLTGDVVCFSLEQIGLLAEHLGVNVDELVDYYKGVKCGLLREDEVPVPIERLTAVDNDGTAYPVVLIGADTNNFNRFLSQGEAQQPAAVEPPSGSSASTTPDTAAQPSGPHSDIPCPKISEVAVDADSFLGKEIMILGKYADLYASESSLRVVDLQDDTKYVYVNYSRLPDEEKANALRRNEVQGRLVIFRGVLHPGRGQTFELLASASFLFLPRPAEELTTDVEPEARVEPSVYGSSGTFPQTTHSQANPDPEDEPENADETHEPSPTVCLRWWDCPWCGTSYRDENYDPNNIFVCHDCGTEFEMTQALNVRTTEQRIEKNGFWARLWSGSSIQQSRRERIMGKVRALRSLMNLNYMSKNVQDLQRAQILQAEINELKRELDR